MKLNCCLNDVTNDLKKKTVKNKNLSEIHYIKEIIK